MKNRKFDRFGFRSLATITHGTDVFEGEISDMSVKGLFINTSRAMEIGENVQVKIQFAGEESTLSFTIPATVARKGDNGVGLSFKNIDLDSLVLEQFRQACGEMEEEDSDSEAVAR